MWDLELSHDCVKMVLWDKSRTAEPLYYHKHKIMQLCMSAKIPPIIENRIRVCSCFYVGVCSSMSMRFGGCIWKMAEHISL